MEFPQNFKPRFALFQFIARSGLFTLSSELLFLSFACVCEVLCLCRLLVSLRDKTMQYVSKNTVEK